MISSTVYRLIGMYSVSSDGENWYAGEGRTQLQRIAQDRLVSYATTAGVYAALSPGITARVCFISTNRLLLQRYFGTRGAEGIAGYKKNVEKALKIAWGEAPLDVLKGPKVRAFYRALMGEDVLVVDGHMINAWRGSIGLLSEATISTNEWKRLKEDYEEGARIMDVPVREFQARIWNEQRKLLAWAKNQDQMGLFGRRAS